MHAETKIETKKILLVEDVRIAQLAIRCLFEPWGFEIDVANNGTEAAALFEPGKYALILMDIGLPDFSGYIVTRICREKEKRSAFSVPIIGVSAHALSEVDVQNKAREAGINEMFSKPLLPDQAKSVLVRYGIRKEEDFLE